jgi:50S ribosomal subunit-associated GTPase HflX
VPLESLEKNKLFGAGRFDNLRSEICHNPQITAVFINKGLLKYKQLEELQTAFQVPIFDRYKIVMEILRIHATSMPNYK